MEKVNLSKEKSAPRYGKRCLGKGVFVSNDTRMTGLNNNDIVIAGTGAGKTGSIVYTQLKTLNDSSLIVADSKNMLHRMFKDELKKKGYKVRVLDFVNPESSCLYNPLDYIRKNKDGSYNEADIVKLAKILLPDDMTSHERFWTTSGKALLEFLIAYTMMALPKEDHSMYAVSRVFRAFNNEMGEAAILRWIEEHPNNLASIRYDQFASVQVADKMTASFIGMVNTALYPFDIRNLRHIFDPDFMEDAAEICADGEVWIEVNDFEETLGEYPFGDDTPPVLCDDNGHTRTDNRELLDLVSLTREKTVLFLNISDTDHSLDVLVNMFYTQALQTLVSEADKQENGQLPVPCRIIFDDFASGTVIPDFDKVISVIRSRDIWTTIMIQSLSQLESLYSKAKSTTILNNADHIIFLGGNDLDSATFIGTRANKTPEQVLAMDRTKEYFIEGGKEAKLIDKVPPYSYEDINDLEMDLLL